MVGVKGSSTDANVAWTATVPSAARSAATQMSEGEDGQAAHA